MFWITEPSASDTNELPKYLNKCRFIPGSSEYQNIPENNILSVNVISSITKQNEIDPA